MTLRTARGASGLAPRGDRQVLGQLLGQLLERQDLQQWGSSSGRAVGDHRARGRAGLGGDGHRERALRPGDLEGLDQVRGSAGLGDADQQYVPQIFVPYAVMVDGETSPAGNWWVISRSGTWRTAPCDHWRRGRRTARNRGRRRLIRSAAEEICSVPSVSSRRQTCGCWRIPADINAPGARSVELERESISVGCRSRWSLVSSYRKWWMTCRFGHSGNGWRGGELPRQVQCAVGGITGQHTDVGESVDGDVGPEVVLQQRLMDDEPAENDRSGETDALGNGGHQCGQRGGRFKTQPRRSTTPAVRSSGHHVARGAPSTRGSGGNRRGRPLPDPQCRSTVPIHSADSRHHAARGAPSTRVSGSNRPGQPPGPIGDQRCRQRLDRCSFYLV